MTKFEQFNEELIQLLDKYEYQLAPSDYDDIQVWDRHVPSQPAFYSNVPLVDRTSGN